MGHRGLVVPIDGGQPVTVGESRGYFDELAFSPDGRWLAYDSNESARTEVYVVPLPPTGERWQISPSGGAQPRWRVDGKELMYIALDGTIMGTAIAANTRFEAGTPKPFLRTRLVNPSVRGAVPLAAGREAIPDKGATGGGPTADHRRAELADPAKAVTRLEADR